ncbi:MAG TPA: hypothetical protein VF037_02860 [Gemmatimonadales bacterium]
MRDTLLRAFGALILAVWLHGLWSYVQMVRHRRAGTSAFSVTWSPGQLTPEGLVHRKRVLWSWAAIAILLVAALLLGGVHGAR